jgi:biotin operon repressor
MGGKRAYYYFAVHCDPDCNLPDDMKPETPRVVTRYFTSGFEVAAHLGICRATVFKAIKNPHTTLIGRGVYIERLPEKMSIYTTQKVPNVEVN